VNIAITVTAVAANGAFAGASRVTGSAASRSATCSKVAALQNDKRLGMPLYAADPVAVVLCGAFAGPGE
jgi:hypothetical protein